MVYVRLSRDWTDHGGALHGAGDLVDVDAITLAELEADGTVGESAEGSSAWPGPTTPGEPDDDDDAWPGPTTPPPPPGDPEKARA
jgi:hypothetical protein